MEWYQRYSIEYVSSFLSHMKKLFVVESPTKVKVISKYLPKDYDVIATYGHISELSRNSLISSNPEVELLAANPSVNPNKKFKLLWTTKRKLKHKHDYDEIILATDPDREGEAISWHVSKRFKGKKISRILFNSITKKAILEALQNPRNINMHLVESYLTRLSLDYIVGFGISPILWRKLKCAKSAGRVQSVALKILAVRELEIKEFKSDRYWNITMLLDNNIILVLDSYKEKNVINDIECYEEIISKDYILREIKRTSRKISPKPPFITSTLQQEASSKLGFPPEKTMIIAQSLYEGKNSMNEGLITYMRTDSYSINKEFLLETRNFVKKEYPDLFLEREYKSKTVNAQEAHEAIRVTNLSYNPLSIKDKISSDQYKLYELIWNRMIMSQMKDAIYNNTKYTISSKDNDVLFSYNESKLAFRGFKYLNTEEDIKEEKEAINKDFKIKSFSYEEKYTQPPSRYSEASLIKTLEELGIGRPSTYATTINILKERKYVNKVNNILIPNNNGILLFSFLESYFGEYINYEFTNKLESSLDEISNGTLTRLELLDNFWNKLAESIKSVLKVENVLSTIENDLSGRLWSKEIKCCNKEMSLRVSSLSPFLVCDICNRKYSLDLNEYVVEEIAFKYNNIDVIRKIGPYGKYLEWNENGKIKRTKDTDENNFKIIATLPKKIYEFDGKDVLLKNGIYGFYINVSDINISIEDPLSLTDERVHSLIVEKLNVKSKK